MPPHLERCKSYEFLIRKVGPCFRIGLALAAVNTEGVTSLRYLSHMVLLIQYWKVPYIRYCTAQLPN